jgi:hypothetical protein
MRMSKVVVPMERPMPREKLFVQLCYWQVPLHRPEKPDWFNKQNLDFWQSTRIREIASVVKA